RWTQVTGQDQRWSLFAPGVFKVTGFPALVLVEGDDEDSAPALARTIALMNRDAAACDRGPDDLRTLRGADLEPPAVRAVTRLVMPLAAASPCDAAIMAALIREPAVTVAPLDVDLFLSDNEPADRNHFARVGNFRLRRFESFLIPYLSPREDETD